MSRFNQTPSPAYSAFVKTIQEYATTDHDAPREDVLTAVADALEDHLRNQFKQKYEVDETADTACIGRLIAGGDACHHTGLVMTGAETAQPPHQPPHADHADLWLRDGTPEVFSMHLYDLNRDELQDLLEFADRQGLDLDIDPSSWYHVGQAIHVVFYPLEWLRKSD